MKVGARVRIADVRGAAVTDQGRHVFDGHNDAVRSSDILVEGETIAADAPVIDVEPGRLADLALFAGNITEDVAVATRISHVVKSGRLYDSRALLGVAEPDVSRYFPSLSPRMADRCPNCEKNQQVKHARRFTGTWLYML